MYSSYSEMINHAVATSKTEWIILINDRVKPTPDEVRKMINLLENGYAFVMLYNVAFMGFSKELIRNIGWWDERFLLGGWEDRDWVWRLKQKNLCIKYLITGCGAAVAHSLWERGVTGSNPVTPTINLILS